MRRLKNGEKREEVNSQYVILKGAKRIEGSREVQTLRDPSFHFIILRMTVFLLSLKYPSSHQDWNQ